MFFYFYFKKNIHSLLHAHNFFLLYSGWGLVDNPIGTSQFVLSKDLDTFSLKVEIFKVLSCYLNLGKE